MGTLLGWFFLAALALQISAIRYVPIRRVGVVERGGRYHRVLSPGLHLVIPLLEWVRARVDTSEQISGSQVECVTADDTRVTVDLTVYFQVTDPAIAAYQFTDPMLAIGGYTEFSLRAVLNEMPAERAHSAPGRLAILVRETLTREVNSVGITITHVEIQAIRPG